MTTRRDVFAGAPSAAGTPPGGAAAAGPRRPVGTWAAPSTTVPASGLRILRDQTVRHVVHTSVGGDDLWIRLTNEFGDRPLRIGEVHVACRAGSGASTDAVPGTDRQVTFGGRTAVTVPAGAPWVSDPSRCPSPPGPTW